MRALVTGMMTPVGLFVVRRLAEMGFQVTAAGTASSDFSLHSKAVKRRLVFPSIRYQPERFARAVLDELASGDYDIYVPTFEDGFVMSYYAEEINKYARFISMPFESILFVHDKGNMARFGQRIGVPPPNPTFVPVSRAELPAIFEAVDCPVVVKPRRKCNAHGQAVLDDPKRLPEVYADLLARQGADDEDLPMIQRRVKGPVLCTVGLARDGELLGQVVFRAIRVYPRDGGTSAYKVAIENSVVEAHDRALVRALRWTGFWSTDYMLDETTGECTLIDVNPRMAPGIILAYNAGCDLFGAYVDMLLRREVRAVHRPRPGTKARMQFLDLACLVDVFLHGADMTFGQKLAYLGEWRRRDSCYDDVIDRRDIKPLVMMYLFILRNLPRLLGPKGGEVFLEHVMFDEARFPPSAAALTAMAEAAPTGEWPVGEAAEAAR